MRGLVIVLAFALVMAGACGGGSESAGPSSTTVPGPTSTTAQLPPPTTAPVTTGPVPTSRSGTAPAPTAPATSSTAPGTEPPLLLVTEPQPGANVADRACPFSGLTEPGVVLTAAGRYEVDVAADGSWSVVLMLNAGGNVATFEAVDADGLSTVVKLPLYYQPAHPLEGAILDTLWEREPIDVQQYYVDGEPTGLFSGARLPVEWNEDETEVVAWLGLAERSGTGDRGVFDEDMEVTVLSLDLAGYQGIWERFRVVDAVDVSIPAASGTIAVTCLEDGYVRHAAVLAFGPGGPTIERLWRIDPETHELVEIAAAASVCPDLASGPTAGSAVGLIVTGAGGCGRDPEACGRLVDISGATPQVMPWWSHAGSVLDSWGFAFRHAVSFVGTSPDASAPEARRAWLEEFLAWDLGGHPVWRILDEVTLPDTGIADSMCWDADGAPAIGVRELDDEPGTVSAAWLVDLAAQRFVGADADTVRCEVVED